MPGGIVSRTYDPNWRPGPQVVVVNMVHRMGSNEKVDAGDPSQMDAGDSSQIDASDDQDDSTRQSAGSSGQYPPYGSRNLDDTHPVHPRENTSSESFQLPTLNVDTAAFDSPHASTVQRRGPVNRTNEDSRQAARLDANSIVFNNNSVSTTRQRRPVSLDDRNASRQDSGTVGDEGIQFPDSLASYAMGEDSRQDTFEAGSNVSNGNLVRSFRVP